MTTDLYIEFLEEKNSAMRLTYVSGNLLPRANTFEFLTQTVGALVWLLASHRGTLIKAGQDGTIVICESDRGFTCILDGMIDELDNRNRQPDSANLIDLCCGSKLSVELYYLDLTKSSDAQEYLFHYIYDFEFTNFKRILGVLPSNLNNYDLIALVAMSINSYFKADPDLYKPFLDSPEISLARVCLTLTFEEGK